MTENNREILLRTQDGSEYLKFGFPLKVYEASEWFEESKEERHGYVLCSFCDPIGEFKERKHAIHVMNYLLAKRNYYLFDADEGLKSVILYVPTDEVIREIPDENLLDGMPSKQVGEALND